MTYIEMLITVLVVGLVIYAMWRVAQQNPVGTGRLARRMTQLERQVETLDGRIDGIEQSVGLLADASAKTSAAVQAMREEMAADRGIIQRSWEATDRLQQFFMAEGLKRMTER